MAAIEQIASLNAKLQRKHLDALLAEDFTREEAIYIIASGSKPITRFPNKTESSSDDGE
jgi:hypothetical protein